VRDLRGDGRPCGTVANSYLSFDGVRVVVMTGHDPEVRAAVERFHEDVPHRFQVSLTMSIGVRDDIRAVRDELNEAAGDREVTTNDVMRLAFLAAARYHELASGEAEPDAVDADRLLPLTAAFRRVVEDARTADGADEARE
jgi:hypothetical protein